jgi:predicted O-methyltransferase YrrM
LSKTCPIQISCAGKFAIPPLEHNNGFEEFGIMSENSTPVTAEHFRYLAALTTPEDNFLRRLKSAAHKAGIPPIWVSPEQGSFLQILLMAVQAKEVLEIGTLAGYSAIWMARALQPEGHVRTIEQSSEYAEFAKHWIAQSNVAERIEVFHGTGMEVLPQFPAESVDAVFIDADKESYPLYLNECMRIVRRGGIILADNAFGFGQIFDGNDEEVVAIRQFNEIMGKQVALRSIIVPVGDGLWFGVKH